MGSSGEGFRLPKNAKAGDYILAECPVCKQLEYVLVIPGSDHYLDQIMRQMMNALKAHELATGHASAARRQAKSEEGERHGG